MEPPTAHLDFSGIQCGARSKNNVKRGANQELETSAHSTGRDFIALMNQVDAAMEQKKHCDAYLTENVCGYQESFSTEDAALPKSSFYREHRQQFSFRNYTGAFRLLSGLNHGSLQRRNRFFGLELHKADAAGEHLSRIRILVYGCFAGMRFNINQFERQYKRNKPT